jgi:hypothetical protein
MTIPEFCYTISILLDIPADQLKTEYVLNGSKNGPQPVFYIFTEPEHDKLIHKHGFNLINLGISIGLDMLFIRV